MHFLIFALSIGSILFPAGLLAQLKPQTISELVTYNGKDREAMLYAGAKSEGKVTWYTSLSGDSYKGMAKAFEAKYPGVKLDAYRVSGSDMTVRMMEESKAKRYIVDAVETTEGNLMFMRDAFLLRPYHSPHFAQLSGRGQGKRRARIIFLGHRAGVLHRFCLQQEAPVEKRRAEKL